MQEGQALSEKIELEGAATPTDAGDLAVSLAEHPDTSRLLEIEENIQNELKLSQQYGGIIKGLFPARINLLSLRHKQTVYLCWQQGESKFTHWHPVEETHQTRRKIVDENAFGSWVAH